jgi:type III pantothenate kinase
MIVVDIGNTKTMLGFVQDGEIVKTWKMATHKDLSNDEYISMFNRCLLEMKTTWDRTPVCISCVIPSITSALSKDISNQHHFISHQSPIDYKIQITKPQNLGSDMVAAAQGALTKHPAPLIIVDAGTATTISVLNRNKEFIGYAICPGMGISSEALFSSASALSSIPLELPLQVMGKETSEAMLSGICIGHASMIEKMIERIENDLGEKTTVLLTGGAIETLIPILPKHYIFEPTLTLTGLISIYQNTEKGTA